MVRTRCALVTGYLGEKMGPDRKELESQLAGLLERGKRLGSGAGENVQALVRAQLERMDVVPREEFDALRTQLDRAEQRLAELERRLDELSPGPDVSKGDNE